MMRQPQEPEREGEMLITSAIPQPYCMMYAAAKYHMENVFMDS